MKTLKIEITNKLLLLLFLLIFSCQKDYYLDDLNEALNQISSLQSQNSLLNTQISQLNSQLNSLSTKNLNLQASYDDLYQAYLDNESTIDELNEQISQLAEELRIEIAKNNLIEDGYYISSGNAYSVILNDSIIYETEIPKRTQWGIQKNIVKVENGSIVENYFIERASWYWNNVQENDVLKKISMNQTFDYTNQVKLGGKMFINEYTGDSLNSIKNYKVFDHNIFTADEYYPNVRIDGPDYYNSEAEEDVYGTRVNKIAYYKLFSDPYEIIEGITFPPVVDNSDVCYGSGRCYSFSQYNSWSDIKNVYDYSSESNFLSDPIYSQIDQDNPNSYLEAFIKDAERYGVDLSNVDPDDLVTEFWYGPTDQWGRNVLAWGSITCSETNNRIGYDYSAFKSNFLTDNSWYKLMVMYHEFGHTVLGLKHTCSLNHIMTSSNTTGDYACNGDQIDDNISLSDVEGFKKAVEHMFSGYNQFYFDCYLNNTSNGQDLRPE